MNQDIQVPASKLRRPVGPVQAWFLHRQRSLIGRQPLRLPLAGAMWRHFLGPAALLLGSLPAHAAFEGPCFPVNFDDGEDLPTIVIVVTGH